MYNTNTGNLESVTNNGTTTTFGYTDTAHPDRLTSLGGKAIANGTTRAIGRQASVMYKHILPLVDSGIRYILGNGIGTITSKGITVT